MKLSKIKLLAAGLAVVFALAPMSAQASVGIENRSVYSGEAGTVCHCGGIRLVTVVSKIESTGIPCPNGYPNCRYSLCSEIEYFHCSNPYCTDTWYGKVLESYYMHDHT